MEKRNQGRKTSVIKDILTDYCKKYRLHWKEVCYECALKALKAKR